MDILTSALNGDELDFNSSEFATVNQIAEQNTRLQRQMNTRDLSADQVRKIFGEIIDEPVAKSNQIMVPFYTDFGRHIFLGQDVFINRNVTMVDLGGIYIGDGVLLGPNVTITTVNHQEDPRYRRNVIGRAVHVESGAWIGAGAIILPGVTVGANAIVGAGAVVTKNVAANTIAVGSPAKQIRKISRK